MINQIALVLKLFTHRAIRHFVINRSAITLRAIRAKGIWQIVFRHFMLFLCGVLLAGCVIVPQGPRFPTFGEVLIEGEGEAKLLMISIEGPIHNQAILVPGVGLIPGMTAQIRQELELAYDDPNVRGVLLKINSPGGTITDSDVIYHALMEFKRNKKVKIVAAMGEVAASGGIYVAMAADEIYAHPTTITGSIGVLYSRLNFHGLLEKLGVKEDSIVSGDLKNASSPFGPINEKEKKLLQIMIDTHHKRFVDIVKRSRKKITEANLSTITDGRVLTAQQAQQVGLIDKIGYLDDAYQRLSTVSGFPKNQLIRYSNSFRSGKNIYSTTSPIE